MKTTTWARFHAEIRKIANMSWEEIVQQAKKKRRIDEIESLKVFRLRQLDSLLNSPPEDLAPTTLEIAALRQEIKRLQGLMADALREVRNELE